MGWEGRAADNWGTLLPKRRNDFLVSERWGAPSFGRARGAPGDWAGVVTRVHALTSPVHHTRSAALTSSSP